MIQANLGHENLPFNQDEKDAYIKVFEPDTNVNFIYLPDEDW